MRLPQDDIDYLERAGYQYRTFEEGGLLNVELTCFPLPEGLSVQVANVLFRLSASYPDTPPDMWWIAPSLTTAVGGTIWQHPTDRPQHPESPGRGLLHPTA